MTHHVDISTALHSTSSFKNVAYLIFYNPKKLEPIIIITGIHCDNPSFKSTYISHQSSSLLT